MTRPISDAQLQVIRQALAADGLICHVRGAEVAAIIERLDEAEHAIGQMDARVRTDEFTIKTATANCTNGDHVLCPASPGFCACYCHAAAPRWYTASCLRKEHDRCLGEVSEGQPCVCICHDPPDVR